MTELRLRCRCGTMEGVASDVSPGNSNRAVCYCNDCRTFARWLGTDGILDDHAGTDIVQISPAQIRWTEGAEQLRCMRLSPKGLFRFYSACCRTPLGNAMSAKVPFVGVPVVAFVDLPADAVGPKIGVQGRFAPGGVPPGVHRYAPLGMIVHTIRTMSRWYFGGKGRPSDYFDVDTGAPRAEPVVIPLAERNALRER